MKCIAPPQERSRVQFSVSNDGKVKSNEAFDYWYYEEPLAIEAIP